MKKKIDERLNIFLGSKEVFKPCSCHPDDESNDNMDFHNEKTLIIADDENFIMKWAQKPHEEN